jgi:hypothetical protein
MKEERKQRFEMRCDNEFTAGEWREVKICVDGDISTVSFAFGSFHYDGIETRYEGRAYPGHSDGWGYNSIVCSTDRAIEIYRYNCDSYSRNF